MVIFLPDIHLYIRSLGVLIGEHLLVFGYGSAFLFIRERFEGEFF